MASLGRSVMRGTKNMVHGYSEVETKVREATSNEPFGPSAAQMSEISELTFNHGDCVACITVLDKRLNDKGKNWRHVFKSLMVLDHCLHHGSKACIRYFRENIYIIKTLKEFQYIDELGTDQGANVRERAKDLTSLLLDDERLLHERRNGKGSYGRATMGRRAKPPVRDPIDRRGAKSAPPPASATRANMEDKSQRELAEAMRLSREEEERRRKEVAQNGGGALFDDLAQRTQAATLIDLTTPVQAYDPYAAQQAQQFELFQRQQQAQAEYEMALQQQQAQQQQAYANQLAAEQQYQLQVAYGQQEQQNQYFLLQQQQQLAYQQQLQAAQAQSQFQPSPQPLAPQPTGVNNPFSSFAPQFVAAPPPLPTNNVFPQYQPAESQRRDDGKHAELARMLASGNGVDTFGNYGNLRVPVGTQFANRTG